tara:strand:+ start:77 stop:295 length:219 start_codon:yes stop_codon:yes gene_type:complete
MGLFSKPDVIDFKVTGMNCGACERKIIEALNSLKGVKKVEASSAEGMVKVTSKNVFEENLRETIIDVGYSVE